MPRQSRQPRKSRAAKAVLPGLSRSITCSSKSCARLLGHKGSHRQTLTAKAAEAVKAPAKVQHVEVLSADRYTVLPEPPEPKAPVAKPAKRRQPKARKALGQCRVAKARTDGVGGSIRCDRLTGHKAHGLRHRFTGLVTILPEGESVRMVADAANGQLRSARRPKAAPAMGRRDITIAEFLQAGA